MAPPVAPHAVERQADAASPSGLATPPALATPTGGGAVRAISEGFTTSPSTGTGAMSIPIQASSGRGGFAPELALAYDSGHGNGVFGMGWGLEAPSISRSTRRGVP